MFIYRVTGLFLRPITTWEEIHNDEGNMLAAMVPALILGLIPAICGYIGTTQTGWTIGAGDPVRITEDSAAIIAIMYYTVIQVAVFSIGWMIYWMAKTYGSDPSLPTCIRLAAYIPTPLFLVGFMQLIPILWLKSEGPTKTISSAVIPVSEVEIGEEVKVAYINTGSNSRMHKLSHFGIVPGALVTVHQRYPSFVIKCGNSQIALEEEIAKEIYIWRTRKPYITADSPVPRRKRRWRFGRKG